LNSCNAQNSKRALFLRGTGRAAGLQYAD